MESFVDGLLLHKRAVCSNLCVSYRASVTTNRLDPQENQVSALLNAERKFSKSSAVFTENLLAG
jgi:hypothetical protein